MGPFDPRLLEAAPAARRPVAVLAVVGVLQGLATIGLAVALTALVVALVGGAGAGAVTLRGFLGALDVRSSLALAAGATIFCALVFVKGLGVPLPLIGKWLGG